jgi:hypothetical protein
MEMNKSDFCHLQQAFTKDIDSLRRDFEAGIKKLEAKWQAELGIKPPEVSTETVAVPADQG